jgi:hypothetical protein
MSGEAARFLECNSMEDRMWIVIEGTIITVPRFFGPFNSREEATKFADAGDGTYNEVVYLENPLDVVIEDEK